jgi:saccharopine dehydrogenase (NAD+, L-lysine-forming)
MITVYGATGYTGRLVCAELARKKLPFVISGRDEKKLKTLAQYCGNPEIIVAALDDAAALKKMASSAKVVLDCAGPFVLMGRPVQDAAIAAGAHFLDITGEIKWMRETLGRDAEAKKANVALINAVGFDVVPTDCAAVLAAEAAGAPVERVRIAFVTRPTKASQGTARSAVEGMQHGSLAWLDGEWVQEPVGKEVWEVPFPDPMGRKTCVSVPWGDVATAPRSTGAKTVRTFMPMKPSMARMGRLVGPLFKLKPVRALAERWVRSQPEGPSDEERAASKFAVWAEAVGPNGTRTAWVTGGNGYDFTASSAVWCAARCLEADFSARGALTPTQAFGAKNLLDGLKDVIRWGT